MLKLISKSIENYVKILKFCCLTVKIFINPLGEFKWQLAARGLRLQVRSTLRDSNHRLCKKKTRNFNKKLIMNQSISLKFIKILNTIQTNVTSIKQSRIYYNSYIYIIKCTFQDMSKASGIYMLMTSRNLCEISVLREMLFFSASNWQYLSQNSLTNLSDQH